MRFAIGGLSGVFKSYFLHIYTFGAVFDRGPLLAARRMRSASVLLLDKSREISGRKILRETQSLIRHRRGQ